MSYGCSGETTVDEAREDVAAALEQRRPLSRIPRRGKRPKRLHVPKSYGYDIGGMIST
jgi:hypothetical protein